jgi:hypothetical protein
VFVNEVQYIQTLILMIIFRDVNDSRDQDDGIQEFVLQDIQNYSAQRENFMLSFVS